MASSEYSRGVALTHEASNGTWYVVTDAFHPYGADAVGYPGYADAHAAFLATVEDAPHEGHVTRLTGAWYCDTCDSPYCENA